MADLNEGWTDGPVECLLDLLLSLVHLRLEVSQLCTLLHKLLLDVVQLRLQLPTDLLQLLSRLTNKYSKLH